MLKSLFQKLRYAASDVMAYVEFASEGNEVERLTDFAKPNIRPVLLLHGFGTTRRSMAILEKRLRGDGFDVFSFNLGGFLGKINTRGIDDLAKDVKEKIDSLSKRHALGKIAVIGHSKGGLIGRYYVSCLGGSEHVHTLITLGTPHRGNFWAILAALTVIGVVSKSLWQMMPHSSFIKKLSQAPIPKSVVTVSIFSDSDEVVPPEQSRLDIPAGATHIKNVELSGYSHTDYLIKRGVYEEVRKCL